MLRRHQNTILIFALILSYVTKITCYIIRVIDNILGVFLMVSNPNQVLATITQNVLSMVGDLAMKGLVLELRLAGTALKPEEFDIVKVDEGLKKIFRSASELFMEQIYSEFSSKLSENGIRNHDIKAKENQDFSAAEKILSLLAVKTPT